MSSKNVPKRNQRSQRKRAGESLEPVEAELKLSREEQYKQSPTLQSVFGIINTINTGEALYFPRCGGIAVGTVDIHELDPADQKCIICWKKLKNYERKTQWWKTHCVVVAKCGHVFGGKCWLKWLRLQEEQGIPPACLLCRRMFLDIRHQQVVRTDDSIWSIHRKNIRMIEKTMRCRYKLGYWENGQPYALWNNTYGGEKASEIWRVHHILAVNVFLQGADELDVKEKLVYINRAVSLIRELWCTRRKHRDFIQPANLSFVLHNPPMAKHSAVYLNVLHDLISEFDTKARTTAAPDLVKLRLANFGRLAVKSGRICTNSITYPDYYYIHYDHIFPGFREAFVDVNCGFLCRGLRFEPLYSQQQDEDEEEDEEDSDQEEFDVEQKAEGSNKSTADKKPRYPLHDLIFTTFLFTLFFGAWCFLTLRERYSHGILDSGGVTLKPAALNRTSEK